MATVVKFFADRQPRILEGVDPSTFVGDSMTLIDPVLPVGIPPHFWRLGEDGKIEVADYISGCENVPLHNHPHVRVDHHHPAKIERITRVQYQLAFFEGAIIAGMSAALSSAVTIFVLHRL